ncbi:hypothetical protein BD779DRAFT_1545695 [Infundibulicybe gibba]|nr:hypothetical protein BD779DRAFT_1545695 [Infundibulicybe gibba]
MVLFSFFLFFRFSISFPSLFPSLASPRCCQWDFRYRSPFYFANILHSVIIPFNLVFTLTITHSRRVNRSSVCLHSIHNSYIQFALATFFASPHLLTAWLNNP